MHRQSLWQLWDESSRMLRVHLRSANEHMSIAWAPMIHVHL